MDNIIIGEKNNNNSVMFRGVPVSILESYKSRFGNFNQYKRTFENKEVSLDKIKQLDINVLSKLEGIELNDRE